MAWRSARSWPVRSGFDGLFVIKPDGKMYIQSGVGNLGTESMSDTNRVSAEMMGMPWEKVGAQAGVIPPSTCRGPASPVEARRSMRMTRAAHAAATDAIRKLQLIASKALGGKPEDYVVANERVARKGGGAGLTFAAAAQKAIELGGEGSTVMSCRRTSTPYTKRSATALAGQGLMGVARDNYPRDGQTFS